MFGMRVEEGAQSSISNNMRGEFRGKSALPRARVKLSWATNRQDML